MHYKLVELDEIGCDRGKLIAFQNGCNLPFVPKRTYIIYNNKHDVSRGFHAHKNLQQLAVCVSGSCKFKVSDGVQTEVVHLSSPKRGLLIKGLVWREMFEFTPDCVLMVLADNEYQSSDYIRDYQEFLSMVKAKACLV